MVHCVYIVLSVCLLFLFMDLESEINAFIHSFIHHRLLFDYTPRSKKVIF